MSLASLLNGVIYAVVGLLLFAAAVAITSRVLPVWRAAIDQQSVAAAVVLAAIILAIAWIIAAAVH